MCPEHGRMYIDSSPQQGESFVMSENVFWGQVHISLVGIIAHQIIIFFSFQLRSYWDIRGPFVLNHVICILIL